MAIKSKKIFVAFASPGSDQSLFFRLWNFGKKPPDAAQEPDLGPALEKVAKELEQYGAQMRRQQDHVDEIKRLCHVPIT